MKHDEIFTRNLDGHMMVIGNWAARTSSQDAFVGMPLSDSRVEHLRAGREQGKTDQDIYHELYPKPMKVRRSFQLEDMTPYQIAVVAQDLLGQELDSLKRMSKSDLIALVRRVASMRGARIEFEVRLD